MKALLVFGARPNYMKVAPLYRAMCARGQWKPVLVNTGQHFDRAMSAEFIETLELPAPDVHLGIGPGTQVWQIAEIMHRLEAVIAGLAPDLAIVVGDVSSTLAAALASSVLEVPVAHVEAGLRSRDWSMPEERNRVLVDRVSRYLFAPSADAVDNLKSEGIHEDQIFMVGNVMIDSLDWVVPRLLPEAVRASFGVAHREYGLVTLHRPSNVDHPETLSRIIGALLRVGEHVPLLFPVHPRTRRQLLNWEAELKGGGVTLLPPISYSDFIALLAEASLVLTDSGGIQEEAAVVGTPCLTLRNNTERPITIAYGGNELVGSCPDRIVETALRRLAIGRGEGLRPPLWDGKAADRILDVLVGSVSQPGDQRC